MNGTFALLYHQEPAEGRCRSFERVLEVRHHKLSHDPSICARERWISVDSGNSRDSEGTPNIPLVNVDIYDTSAGVVLASQVIYRQSLSTPYVEGQFRLDFNMTGRAGHAIEFRVWTYGANMIRLNKVIVQPRP
jgi:hypothetical protein